MTINTQLDSSDAINREIIDRLKCTGDELNSHAISAHLKKLGFPLEGAGDLTGPLRRLMNSGKIVGIDDRSGGAVRYRSA